MNSGNSLGLGPLYNKCGPCKYPIFLAYCFGLGFSWPEATFCYKLIYSIMCAQLMIYITGISKLTKYRINIVLLCAMWAIELTVDKISDTDSTCLMTSDIFPRFSLWFFRLCLIMITLSAFMPLLIRCFCINSRSVRMIFPQEDDEPEPVELGISPQAFESLLPLRQYSKENLKGNQTQETRDQVDAEQSEQIQEDVCPICLEEFTEGEDVRRINSCEHVFHPHCIERWLSNHINCPYCRNDIVERNNNISQQTVVYQPPLFESLALVNDMAGNFHASRNSELSRIRRQDGGAQPAQNEIHYEH